MDKTLKNKYDMLMSYEWNDAHRELVKTLIETIHSYRFVTPRALRDKIYEALDLLISLKSSS